VVEAGFVAALPTGAALITARNSYDGTMASTADSTRMKNLQNTLRDFKGVGGAVFGSHSLRIRLRSHETQQHATSGNNENRNQASP
jgi:hypothetical protein